MTLGITLRRSCLFYGVALLPLLSCCDRLSREDAAISTELWGGYSHHVVYELTQDVFLLELNDSRLGSRYALSPEGIYQHPNRYYTVPRSVRHYKQAVGEVSHEEPVSGRAYDIPTKTIGLVIAGTRIKSVKATKHDQWNWFFGQTHWVTVYGEILDGPYIGKPVDLTDLSIRKRIKFRSQDVAIYEPNSDLMQQTPWRQ